MSVKIPFLTTRALSKPDNNFFDMIRNRICPNFEVASLSTALILACLVIFVVSRAMYPPGGYSNFLQHPKEMDKMALDIEKIKSDKLYYYQTVTSMFLHSSYKSLIGTLIFSFFILYELETCWRVGIFVAIVAAFAANSMAIATMDGILMGFSGVLCASVGIMMAGLILQCSYIRSSSGNMFYMIFFLMIMLIIMVIGMAQSALVYLFSLTFGLLFGLALYPRSENTMVNANIDKLLKIFSVGFLGLSVLLGLIV